ncbi:phosphate ABC transporter substrate-binding protein [Nostoc sp. CENA543]|uniref:substrate-binding domain-containing protein n=1 Tax=Nostoc sp. CENA543 TaxID=1869241 RepID=UPI000CA1C4CF|nr:substrate-binding domain-containing protein [Nostoc sp. CENA543]AUS99862.1 phosphate ABC transporter substrate-binding protein [Nostoc sp. CENA543]
MKNPIHSIIIGFTLLGLCSCNVVKFNDSEIAAFEQTPQATNSQAENIIKISGSSSTITVLKLLAKEYQAKNPAIKIEFTASSQSEGAISSLKNSLVDIAGSSHKLKPEEDNGKIQSRELATDLLLVATHSSVKGVTNLTTKQLQAIYRGEITNWQQLGGPNAKIIVLDRPEDESAKKLLRKYYLGKETTTTQAVILNKEGELIDTLQSTPHTIGAFSLATSIINQLPVNRLSLNGISPKIENFTNGKYQMVRHIEIIWSKKPSLSTQGFIDFVFSQEGSKILEKNGFVPAK